MGTGTPSISAALWVHCAKGNRKCQFLLCNWRLLQCYWLRISIVQWAPANMSTWPKYVVSVRHNLTFNGGSAIIGRKKNIWKIRENNGQETHLRNINRRCSSTCDNTESTFKVAEYCGYFNCLPVPPATLHGEWTATRKILEDLWPTRGFTLSNFRSALKLLRREPFVYMYKEKFDTERPLRWECVSNETDVKLCGLWSKNRTKAPHSPTDSTWNPFESNNKSKIKIDKVVNNSGG